MKVILAMAVWCSTASLALAQGQRWVMPPYNINMSGPTPQTATIPSASAGPHNISAGAYDQNGVLLFYVKDLNVYLASTSQLKGHLPTPVNSGGAMWTYEGAEIEIVPVPGAELCDSFYVIYTVGAPGGGSGYCLIYARIDWNGGSPVSTPPLGAILSASSYKQNLLEWGYVDGQGLAVSKRTTVSGLPARYLFTIGSGDPYQFGNGWGGVLRWTIDALGIRNQVVIANTASDMNNYYQAGAHYLGVSQLSLSDDQTRLAWGGATNGVLPVQNVFEITLNPTTYTYGGYYHKYDLPTIHSVGVSGVEYATTSNKLYASTWEGIYYIASPGATPSLLTTSPALTHSTTSYLSGSQLQYVKSTGLIVGVGVTNTPYIGKLFSLNPFTNGITPNYSPTPVTSFTDRYFVPGAFVLPDQTPPLGTTACAALTSDFTYQTYYNSPDAYFTVAATPMKAYPKCSGLGDLWKIVELDASSNPIAGTDTGTGTTSNPTCWWIYPAANAFNGFDGTKSGGINNVTCSTPSPGRFANGRTYRITHGIWSNSCPWTESSHTVSVVGHRPRLE